MNGYDFDKTIYDGDSFIAFYFYTLYKKPFLFLLFPLQAFLVLLHLLKMISKKKIKELLMFNLKFYKNKQKLVDNFWDDKILNIKEWYLKQKKESDIIISASPTFLVQGACKKLGLKNVIGTKMDIKTGKIEGRNCWGSEKATRFEENYGSDLILESFYSDSKSDLPMMKKAKKGILVKGNKRHVIYQNLEFGQED